MSRVMGASSSYLRTKTKFSHASKKSIMDVGLFGGTCRSLECITSTNK